MPPDQHVEVRFISKTQLLLLTTHQVAPETLTRVLENVRDQINQGSVPLSYVIPASSVRIGDVNNPTEDDPLAVAGKLKFKMPQETNAREKILATVSRELGLMGLKPYAPMDPS